MLGVRKNTNALRETNFPATPSTTAYTTATGSATIHTKGSWAQLIASTTHDTYGFWLTFGGTAIAATITSCLLDIGIGAAASEVVLINNIIAGSKGTHTGAAPEIFIPLFIAKGTRVSARIQGLIASETLIIGIALEQGNSTGIPIFQCCDTYGANTATSRGTDVTPGNTGAEGSDTSIGSTTTKQYGAVQMSIGAVNNVAQTAIAYHFELRVGAVTLSEWRIVYSTSEQSFNQFPPAPQYVNIASGAQLQCRGEASGTAQAIDIIYHCYY